MRARAALRASRAENRARGGSRGRAGQCHLSVAPAPACSHYWTSRRTGRCLHKRAAGLAAPARGPQRGGVIHGAEGRGGRALGSAEMHKERGRWESEARRWVEIWAPSCRGPLNAGKTPRLRGCGALTRSASSAFTTPGDTVCNADRKPGAGKCGWRSRRRQEERGGDVHGWPRERLRAGRAGSAPDFSSAERKLPAAQM